MHELRGNQDLSGEPLTDELHVTVNLFALHRSTMPPAEIRGYPLSRPGVVIKQLVFWITCLARDHLAVLKSCLQIRDIRDIRGSRTPTIVSKQNAYDSKLYNKHWPISLARQTTGVACF